MNFIGMDIHKETTTAVAKDKQGNIINEARFNNTKQNFRSFLRDFNPEETKIVIESTRVWQYIYDMLEEDGYEVKLSNPTKTKAIACARIKTDSVDASTLADLLRGDLVAESYIPTKEMRKLRDVVRQRKTLVRGRTQIKMIIEEIKELSIKTVIVSYINILEQYDYELKHIEERIREIAERNKQAQLLITSPGISYIRAMEILTEISDISRFENSRKLCSYAGLVPSIKQSGSSLRFGRFIQQSSKTLKGVLIETSWTMIKMKEPNPLQLFYKKLCKKKSKQKAICATARKLCCVVYAALKKNEEFMIL